jgi:hypothetical protein
VHVRVLTLNVWNNAGDPRRVKLIDRGLREIDPDIIANSTAAVAAS